MSGGGDDIPHWLSGERSQRDMAALMAFISSADVSMPAFELQ